MKLPYIKPLKFPAWMKIEPHIEHSRYSLSENGVKADFDESSRLPHKNHIEFSGFRASSILSYLVEQDLSLKLYRFCAFPSYRVNPNDTHGTLVYAFDGINIDLKETVNSVSFDGILCFKSEAEDLKIRHRFMCAYNKPVLIEELTVVSDCEREITLLNKKPVKKISSTFTADEKPVSLFSTVCMSDGNSKDKKLTLHIKEGETVLYFVYGCEELDFSLAQEQVQKRENFLCESCKRLIIETPDNEINTMLNLTKIRASESIFETKNGLMHSPGGGGYYAALWTNDQCEYANPYFAYLGYNKAEEQSVNCYTLYSRLAKKDEAIYTSIIAEGTDYWHGAGDRGDSSMYIYGLSRYLLTSGNIQTARMFIESLETAAEYVISQINDDGTVSSDSDELENRFESGNANLSTACISYEAFISLSFIENELGNTEKAQLYSDCAEKVKKGINSYFSANVEGFETYRYCAEETVLRSWICLPLCMGIVDRADETAKALMSDKLRKGNGILTRSGEKTYWDRSALYAMRGLFYSGKTTEAAELLRCYTHERLLGEHIPYPVEAFPEGNAAQLSAESALYHRIIIEGVLGYRPTGFNSFELKINLPNEWNTLNVKNIKLCGKVTDITVKRNTADEIFVSINGFSDKLCNKGENTEFVLK